MSDKNVQVVLDFLDAMSTSNVEKADRCVGPTGFTMAKGYGKFSGRRERETMVGTIAAFEKLMPGGLNISIKSVTAQDDRVVVEFEGDAKTVDGKAYQNQYCMVFRMENEQIAQVNEYFCNIHADEVLWPLISALENDASA